MKIEPLPDRILDRALTGKIGYKRGIALACEADSIRDVGEWRESNV